MGWLHAPVCLAIGEAAAELYEFTEMLLGIGGGPYPKVPDQPANTICLPDDMVAPPKSLTIWSPLCLGRPFLALTLPHLTPLIVDVDEINDKCTTNGLLKHSGYQIVHACATYMT